MKIQLLSDLHIEFKDWPYCKCDCDVVVLAGDVHTKGRGIKWIKENIPDKPVIYVFGNHEYYGKAYPKHIFQLKELAKGSNIHILENEILTLDGVNFLGCTLWTDFSLFGDPQIFGYKCQQLMTDYKRIKRYPTYSKLRSIDSYKIHQKSLLWLERELSEKSGDKNVIITHHGPSAKSLPYWFADDPVSSAYVSDLTDFITVHKPLLWLHGHLHRSSDYEIGDTRIIANPKGYPDEINPEFDPVMTITI